MNIKIKVNFEGKPEKDLNVVAYAFDHGGQFIAQGLLKDQQVQLSIKKNNVPTHILFGPPMAEDRSQPPSIEELERLHAYEPVWHFDPKKLEYELLQIPEFYWKLWRLCVCRVRGRVFKPVDFYGVIQELPVCHARVHICEVDPLLIVIPRSPDYIIDRIRGELLKPRWPIRFPFPLPDPPPFRFDPHVIDTSPINIAHIQPLRAAPSLEPLEAYIRTNCF